MKNHYFLLLGIFSLFALNSCSKNEDDSEFDNFKYEDNNPHVAVDLGLSVKWATMNIGASTPESSGDFFAWGEPAPYYTSFSPLSYRNGKEYGYYWPSYKYCKCDEYGDNYIMIKYCNDSSYGYNGYKDNLSVLESGDDAAHVVWGGKWRMPTIEEVEELLNKCDSKWTTQNGVRGFIIKSRTNDNSIFLPLTGCFGQSFATTGYDGFYWSSSLSDGNPVFAEAIMLAPYEMEVESYHRRYGFCIRPVCE